MISRTQYTKNNFDRQGYKQLNEIKISYNTNDGRDGPDDQPLTPERSSIAISHWPSEADAGSVGWRQSTACCALGNLIGWVEGWARSMCSVVQCEGVQ